MIYEKYKFKSPLNLFLVQCFCNVVICLTLMGYKTLISPKAFSWAEKYGIKITTYPETFTGQKIKVGLTIGAITIINVLFGLYSVKLVNIPLFLTFRRCAILATIIVQFLAQGSSPSGNLAISATLMVLGALIAGYESLSADFLGYILIWGNNFCSAIQNVVTSKYNQDKKVTAFEINFFFACIGLPLMLAITSSNGDINVLYDVFLNNGTRNIGLGTYIMISGSFGIAITMTSLLTVTICGPLAVNISGTMKDVALTYAGFVFFENVKASVPVIVGLCFSFAGATFYSYDRYKSLTKGNNKVDEKKMK